MAIETACTSSCGRRRGCHGENEPGSNAITALAFRSILNDWDYQLLSFCVSISIAIGDEKITPTSKVFLSHYQRLVASLQGLANTAVETAL